MITIIIVIIIIIIKPTNLPCTPVCPTASWPVIAECGPVVIHWLLVCPSRYIITMHTRYLGKAKIAELEQEFAINLTEDHVFELDVTVHHTKAVTVV